ncbi:MAG: hypothetical protein ACT4OX_04665 [Actinomycetota bacterium]
MSGRSLAAERTATLAPLEREMLGTWWNASIDASDAHTEAQAAAESAWSDALADSDSYAAVRDSARADGDGDGQRQLELLANLQRPHQVPADLRYHIVALATDLGARYAQHRGAIAGEPVDDNRIIDILRTSDDSDERRAAWEASRTVGVAVATDLRTLVHLRNDAARAVGARDHFALTLETTDFDEGRLLATLAQVDRLTAAPFTHWKQRLDDQLAARYRCAPDALAPWHYDDPFFQSPPASAAVDLDPFFADADLPALTERTFAGLGLDVGPILARSDLTPRPAKNQHAFCVDVDRSGDVRVLSNNVPSERWAETMLHECGHGVYFAGVGPALPWLLRTMDMCTTEGVAMLCGRLVYEPEWLVNVAKVPRTEVDTLTPRLAAARRATLLVFARWVLVMTHFERGLYADPDADHDTRWWDLVEQFQLVRRPPDRHAPDWAAKVHVALAPVYYHNYLFGEMIASQLTAALRDTAGGIVDRPAAGAFLADRVFAPGAALRWNEVIASATGAPVGPAAFANDLRG